MKTQLDAEKMAVKIIRYILNHPDRTIAEIRKGVGLNREIVNVIIADLEKRNIIKYMGEKTVQHPSRGRK